MISNTIHQTHKPAMVGGLGDATTEKWQGQ